MSKKNKPTKNVVQDLINGIKASKPEEIKEENQRTNKERLNASSKTHNAEHHHLNPASFEGFMSAYSEMFSSFNKTFGSVNELCKNTLVSNFEIFENLFHTIFNTSTKHLDKNIERAQDLHNFNVNNFNHADTLHTNLNHTSKMLKDAMEVLSTTNKRLMELNPWFYLLSSK
jgi:hypothetical protein